MKKNGIINSAISSALSSLGHTDTIVICDAGLPVPVHSNKIDISLRRGAPSFMEVLTEILSDMVVEAFIIAEEIRVRNPVIEGKILHSLSALEGIYVPHTVFKEKTHFAKAIIRTGEITPYANIILQSGVFF